MKTTGRNSTVRRTNRGEEEEEDEEEEDEKEKEKDHLQWA
jgi:hypothetical protein